jgi:alkylhydroperoxidase/carboxymuconolactone decarboxylase family protein YurZ
VSDAWERERPDVKPSSRLRQRDQAKHAAEPKRRALSEVQNGDAFPQPKIDHAKVEEYQQAYKDLLGFVPPRQRARIDQLSRLDPDFLSVQEEMRKRCMYPKTFDQKTVQLMLFGMLLITLRDAARIHGIAARRAGATWEEMQAVVNLAFLFGGFSVANRGAQYIQEISEMEGQNSAGSTP